MQQYFVDYKLETDSLVELDDEVIYHLCKVLRKTDGHVFRIADSEGEIYFCELKGKTAKVLENTGESNELKTDVTAVISLIKNDKFDLILQKLTEIGVKRIVPYNAERSVIKPTKKDSHKLERCRKICREAAEQSHRNFIPEVTEYASFKDLDKYLSELNILAYEKEDPDNRLKLNEAKTLTFVIGPEGGFTENEVKSFMDKGFVSMSLGKTILRAETAAIYIMANISGALK